MHQTALQQYQATRVETGSAEQLIVMLYEGALRFCEEAKSAIARPDIPARSNALRRASRIVQELSNALNHEVGGELAGQLDALYEFVDHKLTLANLENNPAHVDHAMQILGVLLTSWRKVAEGEVETSEAPQGEAVEATPAPLPSLSLSV